jgi:hypothetical protein
VRRSVFASSRRDRKKARHARVWLDGVEVTADCQSADDRIGRVLLLKRNAKGQHYVTDAEEVAKEYRHGKVVITRREPC